MFPTKLRTRQYGQYIYFTGAGSLRPRTIRAITTMAAVGLGAWCGSGIAQADPNHEQQACALMDDQASAIQLGYGEGSLQYAFAVLSTEMPPADAAHVLAAATRTDCPNHAGDLPPGWQ